MEDLDVADEPTEQQVWEKGEPPPLSVLWRNVWLNAACKAHIRIWQRGDAWGSGTGGINHNDRWWASVAFNPARLHDPQGWSVCPAEHVQVFACAELIALAKRAIVVPQCEHVTEAPQEHENLCREWDRGVGELVVENRQGSGRAVCADMDCLMGTVTVSRVDATLDFLDVSDTALWVDVFMGHRQVRSEGRKNRYSAFSAAAQAGKSGSRTAIYDKHVEMLWRRSARTKAPPGTLRVEVQARSPKLKRVMQQDVNKPFLKTPKRESSRKLAFVTPEFLSTLFYSGFQWAGLDRWVGGEHPLEPRLGSALTKTVGKRLTKWLDARARGRPHDEVIDNTIRQYEYDTAQYGYVVGVPRSRVTGPVRHLDVLTGRESKPSLTWRLTRKLTGPNSGASRIVLVRRRPQGARGTSG